MDFTERAPDCRKFSLVADIPLGPFWSVLLGGMAKPILFSFRSGFPHRKHSSPYVAFQPHSAFTEPLSGEPLAAPFDWLLTVRLGLLSSSLLTLKDDCFSLV